MKKLSTIQKRENLNAVYAVDEKGAGNVHHKYVVVADRGLHVPLEMEIVFQNGARNDDNAINGVIDTDLLEIVRDRLIGFQSGEYRTRENACALTHIEEALM